MVQPKRPLVIIPHGDFEKQTNQSLDDALASGSIKQDKYRELRYELQWAQPFQQQEFMEHIDNQIKNATRLKSTVDSTQLVTNSTVDSTQLVTEGSDDICDPCYTANWWNVKFSPSEPIQTSRPSAPCVVTPPTSVPTSVPTAFRGCASSLIDTETCHQTTTPSISAQEKQKVISSSNFLKHKVDLRMQEVKNGTYKILWPPTEQIQSSAPEVIRQKSDTNNQKSVQSQTEIRSMVQYPHMKINKQKQNAPYAPYISNAPGCAQSVQQNAPYAPYISNAPGQQSIKSLSVIAESANVKSQSLLFNPHCDNNSNFNYETTTTPPQNNNDNFTKFHFQFSVSSINRDLNRRLSIYEPVYEYPLNVETTPAIEPEPPPDYSNPPSVSIGGAIARDDMNSESPPLPYLILKSIETLFAHELVHHVPNNLII